MAETVLTSATPVVAGHREPHSRRAGWLSVGALTRLIGRVGMAVAVLTLSSLTVVGSIALSLVVWTLLYGVPASQIAVSVASTAAIVSLAIGVPLIIYSQAVIRKLGASRHALKRLTEHLVVAREEAERANRSKSAFLANMSHELRTPLNAIIGFSEIIHLQSLGPDRGERYRTYARDIQDSGTHLLSIISDILDISKIEAGGAVLDHEADVDASEILHNVLRLVAPMATEKNIAVTVNAGTSPLHLLGSERMLRQILLNLISNAVKFTPDGGRVAIAGQTGRDGCLTITVVDSGIGMSSADIQVALTPFGQVDNRLSRRYAGTGLGLPIAKAMIELHGGRLWIDSAPHQGTTVRVQFPAERTVGG
jgi:signal transduction histidine kinase